MAYYGGIEIVQKLLTIHLKTFLTNEKPLV